MLEERPLYIEASIFLLFNSGSLQQKQQRIKYSIRKATYTYDDHGELVLVKTPTKLKKSMYTVFEYKSISYQYLGYCKSGTIYPISDINGNSCAPLGSVVSGKNLLCKSGQVRNCQKVVQTQ